MRICTKIDFINNERLRKIGELMKLYRLQSYMSRQDVEDIYGIPRSTIERVENGNNITLLTIFKLLDAYDVPLFELFNELEE